MLNSKPKKSKPKLKPEQVRAIRASLKTSHQLADEYGLAASTICRIRNRWTYKRVDHVSA